jgi:hypothetical protein
LYQIFGKNIPQNNPQGAPYVLDTQAYVSISHSENWVLLAQSGKKIGVDIQKIVAKINTKRVKEYAGQNVNLATFVVRWENPDASLFDFLSSGRLGKQLNLKFGQPSRVMWKSWERNKEDVNERMTQLVKRVMDATSKELM